ncbi:MAG: glycosyltransferase family 39 protein [Candidatus Moranbacteria bacterium]|nr:glycosyltransferase family 39 protein [Candidatus Moranbacteria bacterium]
MNFLKKHAFLIVTGILAFHFVLSLSVSKQESMIFDEKAHIPAAYSYVRYGDMRLNPEHPPLLKDLAGLPLLFLQPSFPIDTPQWQSGINEQWAIGDMFVNCTRPDVICNDADTILFWSRIPVTLVAVILGFVIFIWTRELAGTLAGLFAVTLYAFDPNIIAHNHYVTTDIGIAAFIFFAFYFFIRFLKKPSFKNVFIAGIFLGLAELSKFSAVLLFPVFGLFVILYAITKQKTADDKRSSLSFTLQTILKYGLKFAGSVLICFALIWLLYAWNTINMPAEKLVDAANFSLGQKNQLAQFAHAFVIKTSESNFLKPLSEYFLGVFMVFARVASGNDHYFLGTVTNLASPWYFPVVFLLKETLPFLFLLAFTSLYALYRMGRVVIREKSTDGVSFLSRSFQNNITEYLAVFFILFYSYISITGNLNIGFRHLFPILPFLYMLIAKTAFDLFRRHENNKTTKKVLSIILGGLTLSIIAIPILAYPNYLSYFNAAAGGHLNGYKYVTDSNYDWGQDLKHLQNFVEHQNNCKDEKETSIYTDCPLGANFPRIDKIRIDYFGGASPAYYLKDKYIGWWDTREPEAGWYAISSFFYQQSLYKTKQPGERNYAWLKDITPVTRAGDSIFVYYIQKP